jgi:GAF domain-containing protein
LELASILKAMDGFASSMAQSYDLPQAAFELCESMVEVLGAQGAGVTVAGEKDRLRYLTGTTEDAIELERTQEKYQSGPCRSAYDDGRVVVVNDVKVHAGWPKYLDIAEQLGVGAVLGVPLRTDGTKLGAMDIYSNEARVWSPDEIQVAEVFAMMATAYLLRTSELAEASQRGEQLQAALDSRVVIEQAKGIVASTHKIGVDEAFNVLRAHARSNQKKMADVARAVVQDGYELPPAHG